MTIFILMIIIFVLGYTAIALEHPLKVDKAASALIIGVLIWSVYVLSGTSVLDLGYSPAWKDYLAGLTAGEHHDTFHFVKHDLQHHLIEIAEILFFLFGAMTIVEVVDRSGGFRIITDRIKTLNKVKLLWIFSILTFFMSAALDNLTTTIVMLALIRKIMADKKDKWFFASMVVLASNSGGAWSPIGDVTTIMLWIGHQISAQRIIIDTIFPSFVTMVVPVIIMTFLMKGDVAPAVPENDDNDGIEKFKSSEQNLLFVVGVASLLFVPVFKTVTHLPPYMGMLLGLGNMWLLTEIMHRKKSAAFKKKYNVIAILKHVDTATIFFFMGILTAVAGLQSAGHLNILAGWLETNVGNIYGIDLAIGVLSAIVDNVPLVAGSMGMYKIQPDVLIHMNPDMLAFVQSVGFEGLRTLTIDSYAGFDANMVQGLNEMTQMEYKALLNIDNVENIAFYQEMVMDGNFWKFLAYCAGTGGSILIIGSAAGVAAMGIEKIDFIWYMKKISLLALVGYLAGALVYWLMFA